MEAERWRVKNSLSHILSLKPHWATSKNPVTPSQIVISSDFKELDPVEEAPSQPPYSFLMVSHKVSSLLWGAALTSSRLSSSSWCISCCLSPFLSLGLLTLDSS